MPRAFRPAPSRERAGACADDAAAAPARDSEPVRRMPRGLRPAPSRKRAGAARPRGALRAACVVLAAAVALAASPAHAQTGRRPAASRKDPKLVEAKRHFETGVEAYARGDYEAAIAAWERSYELSKKPLIFESIANAYERLGDAPKAREYLARWREAAPKDEHALLDERIGHLDARIARERDAKEAERRAAEERARREREAHEAEERARAAEEERRRTLQARLPGLVLVGIGGAAIATGVTLGVVAALSRPDVGGACVSAGDRSVCRASVQTDIESSNGLATAGDVTWIAGAAVAVTGAVLLAVRWSPGGGGEPQARAAPFVTAGGAGVVLARAF